MPIKANDTAALSAHELWRTSILTHMHLVQTSNVANALYVRQTALLNVKNVALNPFYW